MEHQSKTTAPDQSETTAPDQSSPIIDSHIHLFAGHHIPCLNWTAELPIGHVLNRGNTIADYLAATAGVHNLKGFIFIETDCKSGLAEADWQYSLDEVAFLARIAEGRPLPNEGHEPADSSLVLGVVPWAPIPAGTDALSHYVERAVHAFSSEKRHLIKGFRYLLQDKPRGVALEPSFIQSLRWLGEHGYSFDLGVDARSAGLHQLDEACRMMDLVYSTGSNVELIINHFCKPNLRLDAAAQDAVSNHPDFVAWKSYIERMAAYPNTYMKLSGLFSELPPQDEANPRDVSSLVAQIAPWVSVVLAAFTPSRIMFGSDWPVCNVGGPGIAKSWSHWHSVVATTLDTLGLTAEEKALIWSGTATKAYNI
ncbi:hypothetical protein DV738_g5142, partial [Chaetothyriales sp. CBS 135597]